MRVPSSNGIPIISKRASGNTDHGRQSRPNIFRRVVHRTRGSSGPRVYINRARKAWQIQDLWAGHQQYFRKIGTEKAKAAHLEQQVEFRRGDVARMPFANETFDFVICTSVFKNFPEPVKVLDEMSRVLKRPDGTALIIDMRKEVSNEELDRYVDSLKLGLINSYITRLDLQTNAAQIDLHRRSNSGFCKKVVFQRMQNCV